MQAGSSRTTDAGTDGAEGIIREATEHVYDTLAHAVVRGHIKKRRARKLADRMLLRLVCSGPRDFEKQQESFLALKRKGMWKRAVKRAERAGRNEG